MKHDTEKEIIMTKEIKKADGLTLTINQEMLNALGIDKDSDLDMIVIEDALIIKPRNKTAAQKKRQQQLTESTTHIINKYKNVLKKLSKT